MQSEKILTRYSSRPIESSDSILEFFSLDLHKTGEFGEEITDAEKEMLLDEINGSDVTIAYRSLALYFFVFKEIANFVRYRGKRKGVYFKYIDRDLIDLDSLVTGAEVYKCFAYYVKACLFYISGRREEYIDALRSYEKNREFYIPLFEGIIAELAIIDCAGSLEKRPEKAKRDSLFRVGKEISLTKNKRKKDKCYIFGSDMEYFNKYESLLYENSDKIKNFGDVYVGIYGQNKLSQRIWCAYKNFINRRNKIKVKVVPIYSSMDLEGSAWFSTIRFYLAKYFLCMYRNVVCYDIDIVLHKGYKGKLWSIIGECDVGLNYNRSHRASIGYRRIAAGCLYANDKNGMTFIQKLCDYTDLIAQENRSLPWFIDQAILSYVEENDTSGTKYGANNFHGPEFKTKKLP